MIKEGTQIKYKFFVDKSSFGGWETGIDDRTFNLPKSDTTLAWRFFNNGIALAVAEERAQLIPKEQELYQNYPNPFNPKTSIKYSITRRSQVMLSVYNILGQLIKTLAKETQEAGLHSITWDGTTESGIPTGSGVYFVKLDAEGTSKMRKMVLLR
jgi:hypothetical protein